jgi:hypothetical protein
MRISRANPRGKIEKFKRFKGHFLAFERISLYKGLSHRIALRLTRKSTDFVGVNPVRSYEKEKKVLILG